MSKVRLPAPPGFMWQRKVFGQKVRYVYPFDEETALGMLALRIHQGYVAAEQSEWKHSRLRLRAIRLGQRWLRRHCPETNTVRTLYYAVELNRFVLQIGLTLLARRQLLPWRRGCLAMVAQHLVNEPRYFAKFDLEDAFGTVYPGFNSAFRPEFEWNRVEPESTSVDPTRWPFFHAGTGGLIQGAPASPLIFDQACVATGLDAMLQRVARENGAVVTRYVDDIVFSRIPGQGGPFGRVFVRSMRKRIESCGFRLNERKLGCFDTRRQPIEFLGVRYMSGQATPTPHFFARMREMGCVTEGHYTWASQIAALNWLMAEQRRRRRQAKRRAH